VELPAELLEAGPALGREPRHLVQVLEGLGEQERVGLVLVRAPDDREVLLLRPGRDAGEVLEPHPVPGPQEDPGQGHAGVGVGHRPGVGEDLDHGGRLEQPHEPHDLRGDPPFGERLLERHEQPALAA
jgi:hypothetical protein